MYSPEPPNFKFLAYIILTFIVIGISVIILQDVLNNDLHSLTRLRFYLELVAWTLFASPYIWLQMTQ